MVPGVCDLNFPRACPFNLKKKLKMIFLTRGRAHTTSSPGPEARDQHLKGSISKTTWVWGGKTAPSAFPSGLESECQIHTHQRVWRRVLCWTHLSVCTAEPVCGLVLQIRGSDHSSPISGFRGSLCVLYPRQHQCYRKNLQVWIGNSVPFGEEPFQLRPLSQNQ